MDFNRFRRDGVTWTGSHNFRSPVTAGTLTVRGSARIGTLGAGRVTAGVLNAGSIVFGTQVTDVLTVGSLTVRNIGSALAVKAGSLRAAKAGIGTTGLTVAGPTTAGTATLRNVGSALFIKAGSARLNKLTAGTLTGRASGSFAARLVGGTLVFGGQGGGRVRTQRVRVTGVGSTGAYAVYPTAFAGSPIVSLGVTNAGTSINIGAVILRERPGSVKVGLNRGTGQRTVHVTATGSA